MFEEEYMQAAEKEFVRLTAPYKVYGDKIIMKINHMMRVRDLCVDVAESLGPDTADAQLAALCGLLHDIGRLEQWRIYQTYDDSKSEDHGDMGAELLKAQARSSALSIQHYDTILKTVKYHNKFNIPGILEERNKLYINITRDADKLDILDSFAAGRLTRRTDNTAVSGSVFRAVLDCREISNREIRTRADGIAFYLAFVFGLQFKRSFEILKEKETINRLISRQISESGNDTMKAQLVTMREHLLHYLDEKTASLPDQAE